LVRTSSLKVPIVSSTIAGLFAVYQTRRTRQIQLEMHRLERELEIQTKAKEQDEQQEVEKAENLRVATLLAKTREEQITLYRKSLQADPRISCFQILGMSRPLDISKVYIHVRLHESGATPTLWGAA
jgi:hypothetical protein